MNLRDPLQFHTAYTELRPHAVTAAARVLRDEAAAEDVAQDVFAQLWRRPAAYDPSRGSLRHFVAMMAHSRALDRWRSRQALDAATERSKHEVTSRPSTSESAAEPVIRRAERTSLLDALKTLPDEQRDALLLAYARDMTAQQISDERAIPLGTVKSRVRLGLQKARANLETAA
jgi:RNA polymerase sigma-70 factor (ECF subfamily)